MTAALDGTQRTSLERLVTRARRLLEDDLLERASGRFGIDPDGTIADEDALRLDPTALTQRRELVDVVDHLRSEGEDPAGAVGRLLREATFTHLNRFVAIRIAEALGLLPPSLAGGRSSQGFRDILELVPSLAGDDTGGYWTYLSLCGDELAGDVPSLFEPRNPLLALTPSPGALDDIVELLAAADTALWLAPDCLGWVYQFFNTGDERRAMREGSAAPRDSRELAVRNQFFTPRYVVDFLVQNSLGRRLIDADPTSPLLGELPLLIDPPTERGEPVDLADVSMLDPACGSGHFLLAGYDVLERAWHHAGVNAAEAAPSIVRSLWGIDIEPRCSQVAAAAIILRARRSCPDGELPRPNIVCARALPATSTGLDEVLAALPDKHRRLVEEITDAMTDAPILGSLLKIEERLATAVRAAAFGGASGPGSLADELPVETLQSLEDELLAALSSVADATTASPAERLLAAEADDAIRFVHVLQRRHDAILLNPPYGLAVKETEPYLKDHYPETWTELYAAFLERALALGRRGAYVAAITSSQYLVTRKMRAFRERLIRTSHPVAIVDLGSGVLEGAAVNTALTVLQAPPHFGTTWYADLTALSPDEQADAIRDPSRFDAARVSLFQNLEESPFSFHVPTALLELFASEARFEPDVALVRTGGNTFDNFRFVRCWWEIADSGLSRGWTRYQKGGEYQPYVAPAHLVLDWRDGGRHLRQLGEERGVLAQVMQSSTHWRQPGLCFPRANRALGVRAMPAEEIFAEKSIAVFPHGSGQRLGCLALLNSTVTSELIHVFGRGRFIENSWIKRLPVAQSDIPGEDEAWEAIAPAVRAFWEQESLDEVSALFCSPLWVGSSADEAAQSAQLRIDVAKEAQQQSDALCRRALGVDGRLDDSIEDRASVLATALWTREVVKERWARDLFSYAVGAAFGRWDVRSARRRPELDGPAALFEPLPPRPPGALCEPGPDYPVELPDSALLLDEPGHSRDLVHRVGGVSELLLGDESLLAGIVKRGGGAPDLRKHLRKRFFKDHLAVYSKSRRKAPIYWPLYVPSGVWGLWVYAPELTRETLFAIARLASERLDHAEAEIRHLRREREVGGAGRSGRDVANVMEAEEKLAEELRRFRDEADRISGLGWEPDLDDGIVLCAAPLANLLPAWKEADTARKEIKAGKYPWATVSKWAGQL